MEPVGDQTACQIARLLAEASSNGAAADAAGKAAGGPTGTEEPGGPANPTAVLLSLLLNAIDQDNRPESRPAVVLGRFRIRRFLGQGGFGLVFEAADEKLGRTVAIKVPQPAVWISPKQRHRFVHEAKAAALLDHPNIVPVFEAGETDGLAYIASAFCGGPTLAEWLGGYPDGAPERLATTWLAQLADAIEHAHRRGILHRDIKPANVLLDPNPAAPGGFVPKLSDFGLALIERDGLTRSQASLGTPRYMAPEQTRGEREAIGPAADVYALGVVLYELLVRVTPSERGTAAETLRAIAEEPPTSPRRLRPGLDRDLEAICLKCLEKDPRHRYGSAAELAADLRRYLANLPVIARPPSFPARVGRWCKRKPIVAALAAGLALSIVVGMVLVTWQWRLAESRLALAMRQSEMLISLLNVHYLVSEKSLDDPSEEDLAGDQRLDREKLRERVLEEIRRADELDILTGPVSHDLAKLLGRLSRLAQEQGLIPEAARANERSLAMFRELVAAHPDDPKPADGFIVRLFDHARLLANHGDVDEAAALWLELAGRVRTLTAENRRLKSLLSGTTKTGLRLIERYQADRRMEEARQVARELAKVLALAERRDASFGPLLAQCRSLLLELAAPAAESVVAANGTG